MAVKDNLSQQVHRKVKLFITIINKNKTAPKKFHLYESELHREAQQSDSRPWGSFSALAKRPSKKLPLLIVRKLFSKWILK